MTQEIIPSTTPSSPLSDSFSYSLKEIIEKSQASVVQVRGEGHGAGAGFVWHEKGAIVTNYHVVANARTRLEVELRDGRLLEANVVDSDPNLDLALLNIPADKLPALPIGDSSKLRIGDLVFAIGHPWGQRGVVTSGVVNALSKGRLYDGDRQLEYIKSDVQLAPGNSGGPLLNAQGYVVGINAMITRGDFSIAIPSNVLSKWAAQLPLTRVTLGVLVQPTELPATVRQRLANRQALGLLVFGIISGGLAEQAGLFVGDVLLDIANKPLYDVVILRAMLAQNSTQEKVRLRVLRGGVVQEIDVALGLQEQAA
ncbi:MAG TPA: trypsin-like peptidase domain-containing protein [Ktedonobacteraceae bacterium]|nr:trypsin-like peptidase domain-containing protein [Ktedonobacteraceae bacterium]